MTLRDDYVVTLEAENDALRERVRQLERLLGLGFDAPPQFGLTAREAAVFSVLLAREMATKDHLMAALYRDVGQDEPEIKIVDVFVCKLRAKLKRWSISIETHWGRGWYMTPAAKARARAVIDQARSGEAATSAPEPRAATLPAGRPDGGGQRRASAYSSSSPQQRS